MSTKRTSAEAIECSDSELQQEDNAKRAKLASLSDTTLHDLPIELLEYILIKAVTMEVKGMKLTKSVWKEKTDLTISRLSTVCSQWSSILTTNFFRNEVHRILEGTAFQQDDNAIAVFQQDDNAIAVFQQDDNAIAVFQQDDNAKRAKLNPLTDTTLHDLPIEILERILLKAVVEEVNSMKLAKRVWKEKADLAISRLSTVCSQWSSILTTNFFRNELHRILDKTAQETIRLEILHQPSINVVPHDLTILKDELFVLWVEQYHDYCINVYDRNNVSEVKEIIQLPGLRPLIIAACNVSNCVYLLNRRQSTEASVLRISKDDDHQYTGSQILILPGLPKPTLSVAADGSLILSRQRDESHTVISMYNANGFWLRDMSLYTENYGLNQIIPKANGNLVLVSYRVHQHKTQITEIDLDGSVVRQYRPSDDGDYVVCLADIHGRLLITDHHPNRIQLLDPEFNLLEFHCPHLASQPVLNPLIIRFDSERMEVVACMEAIRVGLCYITVCRLVDIKK